MDSLRLYARSLILKSEYLGNESCTVYFHALHISNILTLKNSVTPAMFLTGTSSVSVEVKHKQFVLPYIEVRAEERDGREGGR